jgi:hypothetical protein
MPPADKDNTPPAAKSAESTRSIYLSGSANIVNQGGSINIGTYINQAPLSMETLAPPRPGPTKAPSVLSLYMTDFRGKGSGGGIVTDLEGSEKLFFVSREEPALFFWKVISDYGNQSSFLVIYIPSSSWTYQICEFVSGAYKGYFQSSYKVISHTAGGISSDDGSKVVPTGRVFIYHEDPFSPQQLGKLFDLCESRGLRPEFRGQSHALAAWSAIRAGDAPPPDEYELVGGSPRWVSGPR